MFCPNCRSQFEDEIEVCPKCDVPLTDELGDVDGATPPVAGIQPFQMILETTDPVLLSSATALLDGANIPFAVVNEEGSGDLPAQVLVPDDYAEDVQQLLSRQAEDVDDR